MHTILIWALGIVALIAWVSGPSDAAATAARAGQVAGITVGAGLGAVDDLMSGFNAAKDATR